jgi:hypothetical protein
MRKYEIYMCYGSFGNFENHKTDMIMALQGTQYHLDPLRTRSWPQRKHTHTNILIAPFSISEEDKSVKIHHARFSQPAAAVDPSARTRLTNRITGSAFEVPK